MAIVKTITEGSNTYTRDDGGVIYKNGNAVPETNYKYIPSVIGGSRDGASTYAPESTAAVSTGAPSTGMTPTQYVNTYSEGGINYGQDAGGQIYKNDTLVNPDSYKYIPSAVGGSRVDPTPTATPTVTTPPVATP
jgi:hypothetical protein